MERGPTFTVLLDSMDKRLIQMELTVRAGDQASYKISARKRGGALRDALICKSLKTERSIAFLEI